MFHGTDHRISFGNPPVKPNHHPDDELRAALKASRNSFLFAGFFSLFINLLMLTPAIYMLQVYDRVLASSSESTLIMLTILMIGLFMVMGLLDVMRSRILVRTSARLDLQLNPRLFGAIFDAKLLMDVVSGSSRSRTSPICASS